MAQEAPTCFPRIPGNLCQPRDQFSLASLIVLLASAGSLLVFPDQVRRFFGPAEHTAFGDTVGFAHTAAFPGAGSLWHLASADPSTPTCLCASGIPPLLMTKLARGSDPHMSQEEQPAYRDR